MTKSTKRYLTTLRAEIRKTTGKERRMLEGLLRASLATEKALAARA